MVTSDISIRTADLCDDRTGILAVLAANLPGAGDETRYDWLYRDNPYGPARVFVAVDGADRIVGTSAALPRRFRIEGLQVDGVTLSDFAFDPAYRSLGPALKLLKATLAPVQTGEFALSLDFPSETMRAIYRRIGGIDLGPVHRWVRPLRINRAIRKRMGGGALSAVAGAAANTALAVRDAATRAPRDVAVEEWTEPFDERFDALDEELGRQRTVVGVRDGATLDWKYRRHTMFEHRTLVARKDGRIAGYAVTRASEAATLGVVDLAAGEEPVRRSLVASLVRLGRIQRADRIAIEVLDPRPIPPMLKGFGFVRREAGVGPVPVLAPDCPARNRLENAGEWWLNGGDRDI